MSMHTISNYFAGAEVDLETKVGIPHTKGRKRKTEEACSGTHAGPSAQAAAGAPKTPAPEGAPDHAEADDGTGATQTAGPRLPPRPPKTAKGQSDGNWRSSACGVHLARWTGCEHDLSFLHARMLRACGGAGAEPPPGAVARLPCNGLVLPTGNYLQIQPLELYKPCSARTPYEREARLTAFSLWRCCVGSSI